MPGVMPLHRTTGRGKLGGLSFSMMNLAGKAAGTRGPAHSVSSAGKKPSNIVLARKGTGLIGGNSSGGRFPGGGRAGESRSGLVSTRGRGR